MLVAATGFDDVLCIVCVLKLNEPVTQTKLQAPLDRYCQLNTSTRKVLMTPRPTIKGFAFLVDTVRLLLV